MPVRLTWTLVADPNHEVNASLAASRPFPARLGAGQQLLVYVDLTRPTCPANYASSIDGLDFHYTALGVHHVLALPFDGHSGGTLLPILACYPASALGHIDRSDTANGL